MTSHSKHETGYSGPRPWWTTEGALVDHHMVTCLHNDHRLESYACCNISKIEGYDYLKFIINIIIVITVQTVLYSHPREAKKVAA